MFRDRRKGKNMYFDQVEFGRRIRELRKGQGKTQEELSFELDISYEHYKKVELGTRTCSLDLLLSLSAYYDLSTDYLLTGRNYENRHPKDRLEAVIRELSSIISEIK